MNRHQQQVIEYLVEENRVLKEQMKGRRLRLTDEQRRRLAAKGKLLGRQTLNRVASIVTPDTILRWHRHPIALNWRYEARKVHFAGATSNPGESFMAQVARNLTDAVDGFLAGHRFLISDRDSKFSAQVTQILKHYYRAV